MEWLCRVGFIEGFSAVYGELTKLSAGLIELRPGRAL